MARPFARFSPLERCSLGLLSVLFVGLSLGGVTAPRAQDEIPLPRDVPSLISADEIVYDQDLAVVTASGQLKADVRLEHHLPVL